MSPNYCSQPSLTKPQQIGYRDWTILIFPAVGGYRPLCIASETNFWTDEMTHPTPEGAIAHGKRFIDATVGQVQR